MSNSRYCFPEFANSSPHADEDTSADCNTFHPVFRSAVEMDGNKHSDKKTNEVELALTNACDKGFAEGYQQGALEGGRIAQSALLPGVEHLCALIDQVSEMNPQISEIIFRQTLNLAEKIVERVTGEQAGSPEFSIEDFQPLLREKVDHSLNLILHLNENDLKTISDLIENSDMSFPLNNDGIIIEGDSNIEKGGILIDERSIVTIADMTVEDLTNHPSN